MSDTYEGSLPNTQPQAPRSISVETADRDSEVGRNNTPYNPGSEAHGAGCSLAGEPSGDC